MSPLRSAARKSPASSTASDRQSVTILLRENQTTSSSIFTGVLTPALVICVPSSSRSPRMTGARGVVIAVTMSLPLTAS